jgi:hypothetical protein
MAPRAFDSLALVEQMARVYTKKACKTSGDLPPRMSTSLEGGVEVIMSCVEYGIGRKSCCFPRLQLFVAKWIYCAVLYSDSAANANQLPTPFVMTGENVNKVTSPTSTNSSAENVKSATKI